MAVTLIKGGPRDGDAITCQCVGDCQCESFSHGAPDGNKIMDGFVEFLVYRREYDCWVPDHIEREAMICKDSCPRCQRPMPPGITYCKNCGAEMDPSSEWESQR